ncbi:sugar phosphate nucleotidyltransferase, partial [Paracoccaceae bacterium]|nr:sugar phosphate nucleotidyltransferase [Paracoccaceae bacterium]
MILAGGQGTRLKTLVSDRPKPMADINGKPFLYHQIKFLIFNKFKRFIICTGYKGDYIKSYFGDSFWGCSINYSQESEPLGTGGAVIKAISDYKIKDPFILLNGDTYFPIDISRLISFSFKKKASIC